ncbi:MAG TPA: NAD(P)-dependent alcohol dehydrogenase [Polyangiaceae bacterium]|nr:NAD(P)-dependent alcohol dehydrogenase [Polyangiaceae bacterium]
MKAFICTAYGPPNVLEPREVPAPAPRRDEVLIRVRAAGVTASDIFIRSSQVPLRLLIPMRLMLGITKPRKGIIGEVLAGEIAAVGEGIRRFEVGDRVAAVTGFSLGAYAEYKCMKEVDSKRGCLTHIAKNIGFEAATVAAYGGALALQFLERDRIQPGRRVLVYGASGTCGTIAVQLAKYWGAEVTGVCSAAHVELVRELGADEVLDYSLDDSLEPNACFDFVLDAVGRAKTSKLKDACRRALAAGGKYASIDDAALQLDSGRLERLNELIETGHVRPVVDRTYPFEKLAEAHDYVERGHKAGGVAVSIGDR